MGRNSELVNLLIIIAILVGGWLVINNVKITYRTMPSEDDSLYCKDGSLYQRRGIFYAFSEMADSMKCIDYVDSVSVRYCEGDKVMLKCKASIYSRFFKQKGIGLFD
ncbi:hypothetical protein KY343_07135 [Candidatus Woesearchaeota archaeon]|nr:hypothetical protein [Candidatus Woesearchaeota archaeon]